MPTILGIDEAGRGPVIGPMVIAGVRIKKEDEYRLKNIGVKDSKLLSPLQRERLFDSILEIAESYKIIILSPKDIDNALDSPNTNLNWLEADTSVEILNALKPDEAYIDCPSTNIKKYSDYIKNKLTFTTPKLIVEHKADFNYPVCSAASILAKVTRDAKIEEIKQKIKMNFGSGYPSDPVTQEFLKNNHKKFPEIFRKSWESYKKAVDVKKQKNLFEY